MKNLNFLIKINKLKEQISGKLKHWECWVLKRVLQWN